MILDRRDRLLVRAADAALAVAAVPRRLRSRRERPDPRRILLLRLERIGDLLMALEAIRDVRTLAPAAKIDLVVGSWNADIARAIPSVDSVETLDAAWLARDGEGHGVAALAGDRMVVARSRLRPRDQFRAGRPKQSRARRVRSRADGRMRRAEAEAHCSISRSTTTRRRTPPTTRDVSSRPRSARTPPDSARPLFVIPKPRAAAAASRLRDGAGTTARRRPRQRRPSDQAVGPGRGSRGRRTARGRARRRDRR